ncbi:division/cell wall cluster transcriptional repressor MraZ [Maricaulis maris]|uniref:Transcriptional regulator MraZ n=1 Tax=Maricaulis maris TaxID=74318 RepID=A0A495DEG3_9PROT|nr:division/cell wall cluster transcriptional repressor MraZ [Maricaulis maris]RKR00295.1 division/cell wall cluster transcriptional repressor MraZ [Maricaulis maris]
MFLSTTINGVDAKGRVSVPADFRAVVRGGPFDGIICWPSFDGPYLEGGGQALLERYQALIEEMDPYDDARVAFERAIFGAARPLAFDSNGRVTLPKEFADHAGLDTKATFVGLGSRFEIWSPERFEEHKSSAQSFARDNKRALKLPPRPGGV